MPVGIEKVGFYTSRLKTDSVEIAVARGRDPKEVREQVMVSERSVIPLCEDAVTMAVNAARPLLTGGLRDEIDLLIVSTESSLDFGKPLSTWVHHYLGLSANCRNFEIKHACYGGTAAFRTAAAWVGSGSTRGRKALVISTDYSRPAIDYGFDFVGGGCATALIVSLDPQVLSIDLDRSGYWTNHVYDVFRPTASAEIADNQLSLMSYLDALDGACTHYESINGEIDYDASFHKHIYHAPFPGMTFQAHRTLMRRGGNPDKRAIRASFEAKVADGLYFARRIGTCYGASNFVCLLGLLGSPGDGAVAAGDCVSFFSYGSGCQSEFYDATIGPQAREQVLASDFDRLLESRVSVSLEDYERIERLREASFDCPNYVPREMDPGCIAADAYREKGLLVLRRVAEHRREYDWA